MSTSKKSNGNGGSRGGGKKRDAGKPAKKGGKGPTSKKARKSSSPAIDEATAAGGFPYMNNDLLPEWMNPERCRLLTLAVERPKAIATEGDSEQGCVVYWMQRDMRIPHNWAFLMGEHLAHSLEVPLRIVYGMPPPYNTSPKPSDDPNEDPKYLPMTERHGTFLLGGLKVVEKECHKVKVPFDVLLPTSINASGAALELKCSLGQDIATYASNHKALAIVTDMTPLRHHCQWTEIDAVLALQQSTQTKDVPLYQVDAHNVIPVWFVSPKKEVGARTLRPKIDNHLGQFMTTYPEPKGNTHLSQKQSDRLPKLGKVNWKECKKYLQWDTSVTPVEWAQPGMNAGMDRLDQFIAKGLKTFDSERNDPNLSHVCSSLSPWINYGHVSFQAIALKIRQINKWNSGKAAFIEEGVVRRELSDNFLFYNRNGYDTIQGGAADWARESLELHESDARDYLYTVDEFANGETHDDLWNAAQLQVVQTGKLHGFMRMYWAKKILEWTPNAHHALRVGLWLNDRFALDGNDPNGYVGVAWSVMGVHDMGWKERDIFGKIRYMNYAGCKRKFNVTAFVAKYPPAAANAISAEKKHKVKTRN